MLNKPTHFPLVAVVFVEFIRTRVRRGTRYRRRLECGHDYWTRDKRTPAHMQCEDCFWFGRHRRARRMRPSLFTVICRDNSRYWELS